MGQEVLTERESGSASPSKWRGALAVSLDRGGGFGAWGGLSLRSSALGNPLQGEHGSEGCDGEGEEGEVLLKALRRGEEGKVDLGGHDKGEGEEPRGGDSTEPRQE